MHWLPRTPTYVAYPFTQNHDANSDGQIRIFLITAKYCTFAVWLDESQRLVSELRRKGLSGMSLGLLWDYFWVWWYVLPSSHCLDSPI